MEETQQSMILLQGSIVNKMIKKIFPDKVISSEFKKELTKALSIFILYTQGCQDKKRYGKDQILNVLEQEGLGKVAERLRNSSKIVDIEEGLENRKKAPEVLKLVEQ